MIIGTTPTFTFKLKYNCDADLQAASGVYITFKQGSNVLTKTGQSVSIVDSKTAVVTLTQAESFGFSLDKKLEVQMNWTYTESNILKRAATKVMTIELGKQLLSQELS